MSNFKFKSLANLAKLTPKISEIFRFGSKTHTPKVKGIPHETIIRKITRILNKYTDASVINRFIKNWNLSGQIVDKIKSIFIFSDNKPLLSPQTVVNDLLSLSKNIINYSIEEVSLSSTQKQYVIFILVNIITDLMIIILYEYCKLNNLSETTLNLNDKLNLNSNYKYKHTSIMDAWPDSLNFDPLPLNFTKDNIIQLNKQFYSNNDFVKEFVKNIYNYYKSENVINFYVVILDTYIPPPSDGTISTNSGSTSNPSGSTSNPSGTTSNPSGTTSNPSGTSVDDVTISL